MRQNIYERESALESRLAVIGFLASQGIVCSLFALYLWFSELFDISCSNLFYVTIFLGLIVWSIIYIFCLLIYSPNYLD